MAKKDERIDAYIAASAPFAQEIIKHVRKLVHKALPDVEETMKWSFPHFMHKGNVCSIASFKQHCAITFHKAALLSDPQNLLKATGETAMGNFGRISSLDDLPPDAIFIQYLKEAAQFNEQGKKVPAKPKGAATKELAIPGYFTAELSKNPAAKATFDGFSYSNKKEYVQWVTEAKTEETRKKRMETAVEWMAEGKVRMWKYIKK